jgi:hypothetical protein
MPSKKSSLLGAALVVLGFAVLAVVLGGLGWMWICQEIESTLRTQSIALARTRGIEFTPGTLVYDLSSAHFANSRFKMLGVEGASGTIGSIQVKYPDFTPKSVAVTGLELSLSGPPKVLAQALDGWNKTYGHRRSAITTSVTDINVQIADTTGTLPPTRLDDVLLEATQGGGYHVTVRRFTAGAYSDGPLEFVVFPRSDGLVWGLGRTLPEAKLKLSLSTVKTGTQFAIEFPPTTLQTVASLVDPNLLKKEYRSIRASGKLSVLVADATGAVAGDLALRLQGFVPPHPAELSTYRFGDTTTVALTFAGTKALERFELPQVAVKAGEFGLAGNGRLERHGLSLHVRMDLSTQLSCIKLAAGLADAQLGLDIGNWVRRNGSKALEGSVAVRVQLDADTSHLDDAKMVRQIGVGCGLKPMTLEQLLQLELPPLPDAAHVEHIVSQITHGGLNLPNFLPTLPTLPTLPNLLPGGRSGTASDAAPKAQPRPAKGR